MSSFSALMQRQIFVFTILASSILASHIEDNDGDTLHHTDYHVASVMPKAHRGRVPMVKMSGQDSSLNGTESSPPFVENAENTMEDTLMSQTVNNALSNAGCKIKKRKCKQKQEAQEAAPAQEDAQANDAPAADAETGEAEAPADEEGDDAGAEAEEAGVLGPDEAADDAASSDDAAAEAEAGAVAAAEDAEDAADPGGAATADDYACEEVPAAEEEQDEDPTPCPTPSPTPGPTPCPTPCPTPDLLKMAKAVVMQVTKAVQMVTASAENMTARPTIAPVQTTTSGPMPPRPIFFPVQNTTLAAVQTTSSAAIQTTSSAAIQTTAPYIVLHVKQGWATTTAAPNLSLVLPVNHTG